MLPKSIECSYFLRSKEEQTRAKDEGNRMKILVGYDGSDVAKRALNLAQEHARKFHAKIYVLHSVVTDLPRKQYEKDKKDLEEVGKFLEKAGFDCEVQLSIQNMTAGEHLVHFAESHKVDELILGIRLKSKVGKFLLGSTAQYVILQAPCPVVSVK